MKLSTGHSLKIFVWLVGLGVALFATHQQCSPAEFQARPADPSPRAPFSGEVAAQVRNGNGTLIGSGQNTCGGLATPAQARDVSILINSSQPAVEWWCRRLQPSSDPSPFPCSTGAPLIGAEPIGLWTPMPGVEDRQASLRYNPLPNATYSLEIFVVWRNPEGSLIESPKTQVLFEVTDCAVPPTTTTTVTTTTTTSSGGGTTSTTLGGGGGTTSTTLGGGGGTTSTTLGGGGGTTSTTLGGGSPGEVLAGCYVDTTAWDVFQAELCESEDGCTETNSIVWTVGNQFYGNSYGNPPEGRLFNPASEFQTIWSGACTGTGPMCVRQNMPNGRFVASANVRHLPTGRTWTFQVTAVKRTFTAVNGRCNVVLPR